MKDIKELKLEVYESDTSIGTLEIEAGTGKLHIRNGYGDGEFDVFIENENSSEEYDEYGFRYSASFEGRGVIKGLLKEDGTFVDFELDGFYMLYTATDFVGNRNRGAVVVSRLRDSE